MVVELDEGIVNPEPGGELFASCEAVHRPPVKGGGVARTLEILLGESGGESVARLEDAYGRVGAADEGPASPVETETSADVRVRRTVGA